MNTANKTRILVEGAMMVALTTVLSMIQFPGPWINGGSITAFAMVPVCLFAFKYDTKWGLLAGFATGLLQLLLGMNGLRGISLGTVIGSIILDYLLAYGVLGFAGAFKRLIPNTTIAFTAGSFFAAVLRFVCHFVSGFVLWYDLALEGFGAVTASFTYNIGYMGPEILITTLGAALVAVPLLRKQHSGN